MTLPPLPSPNVEAYHYDKYQMHDYGKQCREAALEEAAALCNGQQWVTKGGVSTYMDAFNEGCVGCEGAVRGLLK